MAQPSKEIDIKVLIEEDEVTIYVREVRDGEVYCQLYPNKERKLHSGAEVDPYLVLPRAVWDKLKKL